MTGRILRIITRLNVGGPARHVLLIDRGLRDRGWETLLIHGEIDGGESELRLDAGTGPPRQRLTSLVRPVRPLADARALAGLIGIIRRYRPHLVHTHLSKAGLVGRTAALLARPRARRVHTFHGTVFGNYFGAEATAAIVRVERFLGHRTDRIIALGESQRRELVEYRVAPEERLAIVPLGLDLQRFGGRGRAEARAALEIPTDREVVVAAGRLVPIKRLDRLVTAFASVRRRRPAAHLYLIGDGHERPALEAQVRAAQLDDGVTFVGWVDEVADWYAASDVVALSSDREGTPLALIEAAAAARPVVATAVGGVADVVADGETGYLVGADDVNGLAEALERLLGNPELAEQMGHAAPARAERFAANRLIDDLDTMYRELLAEGRA